MSISTSEGHALVLGGADGAGVDLQHPRLPAASAQPRSRSGHHRTPAHAVRHTHRRCDHYRHLDPDCVIHIYCNDNPCPECDSVPCFACDPEANTPPDLRARAEASTGPYAPTDTAPHTAANPTTNPTTNADYPDPGSHTRTDGPARAHPDTLHGPSRPVQAGRQADQATQEVGERA